MKLNCQGDRLLVPLCFSIAALIMSAMIAMSATIAEAYSAGLVQAPSMARVSAPAMSAADGMYVHAHSEAEARREALCSAAGCRIFPLLGSLF